MVFKEINAVETYPVRHAVLRKGLPLAACVFVGDDLATTIHTGVYKDKELVAIASFVLHKDASIKELEQADDATCYQLRGMAVAENRQGQQLGKKLLAYGEDLLRAKKCTHLWFNARELAVPFYKKCDYKIVSELFELPPSGPHYKMFKVL